MKIHRKILRHLALTLRVAVPLSLAYAAWRSLPSWYVLAENDQMVDPNLQAVMSSRMGAHVTRVKSSHSVMRSHPDLVASVILEAFLHR